MTLRSRQMWLQVMRQMWLQMCILIMTFSFTDGSNLFVGQEFPNKEAVKKELSKINLEACFEFETVKSSQKFYAVKCIASDWRHERIRGAGSAVVRDMLLDNFQDHPVSIVLKAMMAMMHNSMNADISYYKAWRGKELADNILKGDRTKSFTLLPCYLHMVEKMNRGSITDICVDEENRFKFMFLAFGACVRGYRSMRKVVSIDGTWLKGKYNGVLLVASTQDGNYHQYPLAWGIVDVVCTSSWSWFLTKLLEVVPDEGELVIILDRHQGIINAVSSVYRNAHHGHCMWHVSQNMKTRCKKKGATEMFLHIAKIYKHVEFDIVYNDFRMRYHEAAQFLDERDSLDRWTRAYCPKTCYNIMTTNGVDSINAILLEEMKLPIITLLDFFAETGLHLGLPDIAMHQLQLTLI
ncbi:protein FAR-RED IMPAIRED RESPONSE 1-like [Primulina tabacum]|uniref:protein FAR-RED IMPAIRED RESPONSE 1-like n=1 Tax=Primulina tabacum TaxID=48773 RepID=UPI003F5A66BD